MAGSGRTAADDCLAAELAAGKTAGDAAKAAGVSERTAQRRLLDPAFQARVQQLRDAMVSLAVGRLSDSMAKAVDVLAELLESKKELVRLRAADVLLKHTKQAKEMEELQRRIEALEQRQTQPNGTRPTQSREVE